MNTLTTKFSIGQRVFLAWTTSKTFQRDCPDCNNERKWKAVAPSGREYEFDCPRCGSQYQSNRDLSLSYAQFVPDVRPLTIESIRLDTGDVANPVSYMCAETGIESGSVWYERDLFETEEGAVKAATIKAASQNTSTEWVVKQFDKTLRLCDYQLSDAIKVASDNARISWEARRDILFDDLRDCEDIDDVRRVLERAAELENAA